MSILTKYPLLRWLVPTGITIAVVGGGAAVGFVTASADPSLPERDAAQLLVDLQEAKVDGMSGTVVERADLGLPEMPTVAAGTGTDLTALLSGSHTLRVWYSGPEKARIALLGSLGETDVILNEDDLWVWDSQQSEATHYTMADLGSEESASDLAASALPSVLPSDPLSAAELALAALDPTTEVTTAGTANVAGRSAYELVLRPKDTTSLVSEVRIAVDSEEFVPLRVQVYSSDGISSPAFEVAFTDVSFERPDDEQFVFNPPEGTTVNEMTGSETTDVDPDAGSEPEVFGTGWTTVLMLSMPEQEAETAIGVFEELTALLDEIAESGGITRTDYCVILEGRLFSIMITTDDEVLIGSVSAEALLEMDLVETGQ